MTFDWHYPCGHVEVIDEEDPVPDENAVCGPCDQTEWEAETRDRVTHFRFMLSAGRMARDKVRQGNEAHAFVWASMSWHWAGRAGYREAA